MAVNERTVSVTIVSERLLPCGYAQLRNAKNAESTLARRQLKKPSSTITFRANRHF